MRTFIIIIIVSFLALGCGSKGETEKEALPEKSGKQSLPVMTEKVASEKTPHNAMGEGNPSNMEPPGSKTQVVAKKEQHSSVYIEPSDETQKLLTAIQKVLKPAKNVDITDILKKHVSADGNWQKTVPSEKSNISYTTILMDKNTKIAGVVSLVTPLSFVKKPKTSDEVPGLVYIYPVKKEKALVLEAKWESIERYYRNIKLTQDDGKVCDCIALHINGDVYDSSSSPTVQTSRMIQIFVFNRGKISSSLAHPFNKLLTDNDGSTAFHKGRFQWLKGAKGDVLFVVHNYLRVIRIDKGKMDKMCGVQAVVNILKNGNLEELYGKTLDAFIKSNPALKDTLTSTKPSSECTTDPF